MQISILWISRKGYDTDMKDVYDTIIIGGGVIGNSIAYHLSERKTEGILLIEKNFPLSGTSGSTQAWVWIHTKSPVWYAEFSMYSAELYSFLSKKIGDFEYQRTGGLAPFFDKTGEEYAKKLADEYNKAGIKIDILDRDEVLEKEPAINPNILGATYSKMDGNINPFRLVEMYMKSSQKNGVHYSFYNQVTDIQKNGDTYIIRTNKEIYECKRLILAAGPWSNEIGRMLNIEIPIEQVRGQILVSEPLSPFIRSTVKGIRQANNGEVLIGYSQERAGFNRGSTLDVIQKTASVAIKYIPELAEANIVRCFSGIRVVPKDGIPILGKIPWMDNLYIAVMHSGITLSPLVGTLMTELILDSETSISLDRYSITRFN